MMGWGDYLTQLRMEKSIHTSIMDGPAGDREKRKGKISNFM